MTAPQEQTSSTGTDQGDPSQSDASSSGAAAKETPTFSVHKVAAEIYKAHTDVIKHTEDFKEHGLLLEAREKFQAEEYDEALTLLKDFEQKYRHVYRNYVNTTEEELRANPKTKAKADEILGTKKHIDAVLEKITVLRKQVTHYIEVTDNTEDAGFITLTINDDATEQSGILGSKFMGDLLAQAEIKKRYNMLRENFALGQAQDLPVDPHKVYALCSSKEVTPLRVLREDKKKGTLVVEMFVPKSKEKQVEKASLLKMAQRGKIIRLREKPAELPEGFAKEFKATKQGETEALVDRYYERIDSDPDVEERGGLYYLQQGGKESIIRICRLQTLQGNILYQSALNGDSPAKIKIVHEDDFYSLVTKGKLRLLRKRKVPLPAVEEETAEAQEEASVLDTEPEKPTASTSRSGTTAQVMDIGFFGRTVSQIKAPILNNNGYSGAAAMVESARDEHYKKGELNKTLEKITAAQGKLQADQSKHTGDERAFENTIRRGKHNLSAADIQKEKKRLADISQGFRLAGSQFTTLLNGLRAAMAQKDMAQEDASGSSS